MFLVTTADQRFWKVGEKTLFLGNWCKVYDQERIWSVMDHEVLPYHWDDRSRLHEDYKYLDDLCERVLANLTDELNKLHNVEHSIRYWRIVVGPWIYYFLQILYDRYLSISSVIQSGKVTHTWLPAYVAGIVPDDIHCLMNWISGDEYNLFLYSQLYKELGGSDYEEKNVSLRLSRPEVKANAFDKNTLLKIVDSLCKRIPDSLNKIAFITSYIKLKDLFCLQLSLGQMPYFSINEVKMKFPEVDESMRSQIQIPTGKNQFESILPTWINQQIPKVYIEGYSSMVRMARKAYPKKAKIIFTSNAIIANESFKLWTGENVEKGVKLVGTQHGGGYGIARWCANEAHEIKVADRYFTWGWRDPDNQTTVPLASSRLSSEADKIKNNPSGRILWTGWSILRNSHWLYSSPVGPQYLDFIDEQKSFLKSVSPSVRKLLLLRLYPSETDQIKRGFNEDYMWQNLDSSLEVYRGAKPRSEQLNESRLSIGTYNGMGILETLSANYPTIIFWNPNYWELRESAKPAFDILLSAGIFHETPQSAASKVNEIYQDVQSWWMSIEIQRARKIFCDQFCNTSKPLIRLKEELLKLL
jgi:putative transferase (TIGR04331 family)